MWIQTALSVLLALKDPHIPFPLSSCWFFVVLGPLPGEPLSDQLRHIIKCCKRDYQELNKKRDSHAEAHQPKSGEERLVWFIPWPRTRYIDYAYWAWFETEDVYKTIACCSTEFWLWESLHPGACSFWGRQSKDKLLATAELHYRQSYGYKSDSHLQISCLILNFSYNFSSPQSVVVFRTTTSMSSESWLDLQKLRSHSRPTELNVFPVPLAGDLTHTLTI